MLRQDGRPDPQTALHLQPRCGGDWDPPAADGVLFSDWLDLERNLGRVSDRKLRLNHNSTQNVTLI